MTENNVAADLLRDHGFDSIADAIESPLAELIGKRVAIYGPSYIWRGVLERVSPDAVVLSDVYQVFETGDHSNSSSEGERMSDFQVFPVSAICNIGPTNWA